MEEINNQQIEIDISRPRRMSEEPPQLTSTPRGKNLSPNFPHHYLENKIPTQVEIEEFKVENPHPQINKDLYGTVNHAFGEEDENEN
jgi:hypothetical protein